MAVNVFVRFVQTADSFRNEVTALFMNGSFESLVHTIRSKRRFIQKLKRRCSSEMHNNSAVALYVIVLLIITITLFYIAAFKSSISKRFTYIYKYEVKRYIHKYRQ